MTEKFFYWQDVEQGLAAAQATDTYRQNISVLRHPLGISASIVQRELANREQGTTWASDSARAAMLHIEQLIGSEPAPKAAPAPIRERIIAAMTPRRETAGA